MCPTVNLWEYLVVNASCTWRVLIRPRLHLPLTMSIRQRNQPPAPTNPNKAPNMADDAPQRRSNVADLSRVG